MAWRSAPRTLRCSSRCPTDGTSSSGGTAPAPVRSSRRSTRPMPTPTCAGDGSGRRRWPCCGRSSRRLRPPPAEVERELARRGRSDIWRLAVAGSAAEIVEEFFESDEVRGCFATQGIIGTQASPREPGTAWVMAYHALGGELIGADGTWAWVKGGMGALTAALASAAVEAGVEIRTGVAGRVGPGRGGTGGGCNDLRRRRRDVPA